MTTVISSASVGHGTTDQSWWDTYYRVVFSDGAAAYVTHERPPPGAGKLYVEPISDHELGPEHLQALADHFHVRNDPQLIRMLPRRRT